MILYERCKNCNHTIRWDTKTDKVSHSGNGVALCHVSYCMCSLPCPTDEMFRLREKGVLKG